MMFSDFGLAAPILRALQSEGYDTPTPIQAKAIPIVLMGRDDPLVPVVNGRVLAQLIPNAKLRLIDDGHLFVVTRAAEAAQRVEAFLSTGG